VSSTLSRKIDKLVDYGIATGLIPECEISYTVNRLLDCFKEDTYEPEAGGKNAAEEKDPPADGAKRRTPNLEPILKDLLNEAQARGIIDGGPASRDLFDTRLMDCLTPRPAQVQSSFWKLYDVSPMAATTWYYHFSQDTDYIRRYRIKKDLKWKSDSPYGRLDITINLSKPEKDPKAIAAAGRASAGDARWPKCLLCMENEGYAGRLDHPARQNHRIIPLTLGGQPWALQYSPYVYYNEHCIVLNKKHTPMKIDRGTFVRLFDFVRTFPRYFVGSNADLPIVGGSILSHDHFQGGGYEFPMARAKSVKSFTIPGYEGVEASILNWPMSVIRIAGKDTYRLVELADHILGAWRGYSDEDAFILAQTDGTSHNTITPIARKRDDRYELDLVLRNNITTAEHPLGVYHPHSQWHHIKKENIGLIEVMGLAVLPARLKDEMEAVKEAVLSGGDLRGSSATAAHADWVEEWLPRHPECSETTIDGILKEEIGAVFTHVLEDAGVFKLDAAGQAAFDRFCRTL